MRDLAEGYTARHSALSPPASDRVGSLVDINAYSVVPECFEQIKE